MTSEQLARLGARLARRTMVVPGGCHLWLGGEVGSGYGSITVDRVRMYAHRAAWVVHRGEIPGDKIVRHLCANTRCVRPDHLALGTQVDNMRDMVAAGNGNTGTPRLSPSQVEQIRELYATGRHSQTALGVRFGVTQRTISYVVNNQLHRGAA